MAVITFASQKGGSGKSTLCIHLAGAIALAMRKVLVVDADPQASASNWLAVRQTEDKPPFEVMTMTSADLHTLVMGMTEYDHILIDSPPRVSALARSAILASDLVLIPVQPSSFDVWASSETAQLIKEAREFKPDLLAAFVLNRKVARTAIADDVIELLKEFDLPVLKTAIGQRIAFAESSAGYTVFETTPNGAAAKEIKAMSKDVLKLLGMRVW
ncbi:MAG: ParA family protein [Scytolyngbya sp. HA4215-MV1]|nr:ParA family protein [Scytolyngbya sp. HA4215-MV1]